jgi:hypothetical protein
VRPVSNLSKDKNLVRRLRLGATPSFLFHTDRIDQIAAAAAAAGTDRSKSRLETKTNEQKEEEALQINFNL